MTHTPGPWTAHDDDGTGTLPCVLSEKVNAGGNFYVAQCNVFADARLIAKAPEMLTALKDIVQAHDVKMGPSAKKLRIDIARALLREIEEG